MITLIVCVALVVVVGGAAVVAWRRGTPPVTAPAATTSRPDNVDLVAGEALLVRLLSRQFIHRRVDSLRFIDRRVRVHVSLDLVGPGESGGVVPLAFVKKRMNRLDQAVLRDFDLSDGDGCPLPLLNSEENATAVWNMLAAETTRRIRSKYPGSTALSTDELDVLWKIAAGSQQEAVALARSICRREDPGFKAASELYPRLVALTSSALYAYLLERLATDYVLLTLAPAPGRQLIKFAYDVERRGTRRSDLLAALAIKPASFDFLDSSGTLPCESLHVEAQLPERLEAAEAELATGVRLFGAADGAGEVHRIPSLDRRWRVVDTRLPMHRSIPHLVVGPIEAGEIRGARFALRLAPDSAAITSFLMALLLAVALWLARSKPTVFLGGGAGEFDSAETFRSLLLFVPGVVTTYLTNDGRHVIVEKLLAARRLAAMVMVVVAAIAVGVPAYVATYDPPSEQHLAAAGIFRWLLYATCLVAVMLVPGVVAFFDAARRSRIRRAPST